MQSYLMYFMRNYRGNFLNDMGGLSRYLGCGFERDKVDGVVKMTQTVFVNSLVECSDP